MYHYLTAAKTKLWKSSCEFWCKPTLTAFPRMNFFIVENRPVSFFCILPRPLTGDGSTSRCFRLAWVRWVRRPKFGCWGALRTLSLIMLQRHIENSDKGERKLKILCFKNKKGCLTLEKTNISIRSTKFQSEEVTCVIFVQCSNISWCWLNRSYWKFAINFY